MLGHCVWGTWGVMIHKRHTVPAVTGLTGYWQGMVSLARMMEGVAREFELG